MTVLSQRDVSQPLLFVVTWIFKHRQII